ncbi:YbaN family protein [Aestuariibacter halophilus]|uniref:Inner membrane protein n=1 Tax=Fluctibacter halophilus TaxID=226011 RepID=A0ABS8G3G9_9ALTE|nr:YbaN family protein [Aestuariibacter halophilus]MCC2615073.1 YbaN family protein [Aestuariibacter halophilus]
MSAFLSLLLAYLFLGLAIIGIFIPGLPTVPFLLLTAWFAARGTEKLHQWLYAHPSLGKLLIDWEQQKAISKRSKLLAVFMLIVSWWIMHFNVENKWVSILTALFFILIAAFLCSRPDPE